MIKIVEAERGHPFFSHHILAKKNNPKSKQGEEKENDFSDLS